ncbi:hypothetical protein NEHOM01_0683 [Nematocida homosporus]|uniref:uncharacterized protein n=1 Tax=Nematocida homosporus TaxID=1912981 RepID=UPI00221EDE05|nr:uncharacterized protein NEHOM01_0683 [Nematocida homosporus]KAI5185225.1 hypothetical protein NEHOM01_0683 [Nematocida homosporus]
MSLSLHMNKLSDIYTKIKTTYLLDCFGTYERLLTPRYASATNPALTQSAKTVRYKLLRSWISIGLCIGLALLAGVDKLIFGNQLIVLSISNETMTALNSIGFIISGSCTNVHIASYEPNTQQLSRNNLGDVLFIRPPNPLANSPTCVITASFSRVKFILSYYLDVETAKVVLNALRKIAIFKASDVYIVYKDPNPKCYQHNLLILSRVVNMMCCTSLSVCFDSDLKKDASPDYIDWTACLEEAQSTLHHANYDEAVCLKVSSTMHNNLPGLINSGIPILRRISSITIMDTQFKHISYISQLPLIDGYTLCFSLTYKMHTLDLTVLQMLPYWCNSITIEDNIDGRNLTILGLEDAIEKHPIIALDATWKTIFDLGIYSKTLIHVHTLRGFDVNPESLEEMIGISQLKTLTDPRIMAYNVVSKISTEMPCRLLEYYVQYYTPTSYAKFGILTKYTRISYNPNRSDFQHTLDFWAAISAISAVPPEIHELNIMCHGQRLSHPGQRLQETVNIQLNHPELMLMVLQYQRKGHICFCQNIRYRIIHINGHNPSSKPVSYIAIRLLSLLQSVSVFQLKISNACDKNYTFTNFDMNDLTKKTPDRPKYRPNIKILVLDNVDQKIINWIFQHYDFFGPVKVYILNQHFKNLAIAQILSHPVSNNITALVVNDFLELDEVVHYKQPLLDSKFSLFNYIETVTQPPKSPSSLGLHKLYMQLTTIDFGLYSEILSELVKYHINLLAMKFEEYLASASVDSNQISMVAKSVFTLYNVTLPALESNFVAFQPSYLAWPNEVPANTSQDLKKGFKKLTLCFSDNPILTEASIVTIIRWTVYRFKEIRTLRIIGIQIAANEKEKISSRNYWVVGLEVLCSILIMEKHSQTPLIGLLAHPCHVLGGDSTIIMVERKDLTYLIKYTNYVDALKSEPNLELNPEPNPIPTPDLSKTNPRLQRIIDDINKHKPAIECRVCYKSHYMPPGDLTAKEEFDPENHITAFFYFKCGHPLCSDCVSNPYVMSKKECPFCRRPGVYEKVRTLVSFPRSNIVLPEDTANTPTDSIEWFTARTLLNDRVYLYLPIKDTAKSAINSTERTAYYNYDQMHVI